MPLFVLLVVLLSTPVFAEPVLFVVLSADDQPVSDAVVTAGPQITAPATTTTVMDQVNVAYAPYVLPVVAGQQVEFPNSDNVRHHVYSFSPTKPFDLRLYSGEPESPIEFPKPGVVVLGCNIHDNMVGYLYVTNRAWQGVSDQQGELALEPDAPLALITVWHPELSLDAQQELSFALADLPFSAGRHVIKLPMAQPAAYPQAIKVPGEERFSRFRRPGS